MMMIMIRVQSDGAAAAAAAPGRGHPGCPSNRPAQWPGTVTSILRPKHDNAQAWLFTQCTTQVALIRGKLSLVRAAAAMMIAYGGARPAAAAAPGAGWPGDSDLEPGARRLGPAAADSDLNVTLAARPGNSESESESDRRRDS